MIFPWRGLEPASVESVATSAAVGGSLMTIGKHVGYIAADENHDRNMKLSTSLMDAK